jgi:Na+/proline symporter
MIQMIVYMSIVLYAPALALSAVTGLSKWAAIISVGLVCTLYCTIGGIKAVLWTDVFQSLLMFAAMIIIIIKGTLDVGGVDVVWQRALEGQRIQFFKYK